MDKLITSKEYNIHYYEIDYKNNALISSLMNYMGDIAMQQVEDIGQGMEWLKEKHLGWVLYKWDINIIRYPEFGERVTVRNWPYSIRKFYAYKKYDILDEKGNTIAVADSLWFLIDTEKRRPKKVLEEIYEGFRLTHSDDAKIEFDDLFEPETIDQTKSFNVRYSDIDTNRHVNNVKYIDWCIETVPANIMENYSIKNLKVVYEKESVYGGIVNVYTEVVKEEDKIICHHKVEDESGKRLTLVRSLWQ